MSVSISISISISLSLCIYIYIYTSIYGTRAPGKMGPQLSAGGPGSFWGRSGAITSITVIIAHYGLFLLFVIHYSLFIIITWQAGWVGEIASVRRAGAAGPAGGCGAAVKWARGLEYHIISCYIISYHVI